MDLEHLALAHQKTDDRSLRNEGRIEKLEEEHKILIDLAKSVAVMAEKLQNLNNSVDGLADKVARLEEVPGKRWEAIIAASISAIAGIVIGYFI